MLPSIKTMMKHGFDQKQASLIKMQAERYDSVLWYPETKEVKFQCIKEEHFTAFHCGGVIRLIHGTAYWTIIYFGVDAPDFMRYEELRRKV